MTSKWPALVATSRGALWRTPDGTIERLSAGEAGLRAAGSLPLVCHAPAVAARLGLEDLRARDLLALFAFVRPARFCLPTVRGLCEALEVALPTKPEEELAALPVVARALIDELEDMAALASPELRDTALGMARKIAAKSPAMVRLAKEALNGVEDGNLEDKYRWEQGFTLQAYMTADSTEARDAFVERREARFDGDAATSTQAAA